MRVISRGLYKTNWKVSKVQVEGAQTGITKMELGSCRALYCEGTLLDWAGADFFDGHQQLYKRCALCLSLLCSSFATLQRTAEEWLKRSAKKV